MTSNSGPSAARLQASPAQKVNHFVAGWVARWVEARRQRRALACAAVVNQVLPAAKPQVRAHQRTALLHAQLAAEIGWKGLAR